MLGTRCWWLRPHQLSSTLSLRASKPSIARLLPFAVAAPLRPWRASVIRLIFEQNSGRKGDQGRKTIRRPQFDGQRRCLRRLHRCKRASDLAITTCGCIETSRVRLRPGSGGWAKDNLLRARAHHTHANTRTHAHTHAHTHTHTHTQVLILHDRPW